MKRFNVGDMVHLTTEDSVKWAGNYKVVKVNPTTYGLVRQQDGARLKAGHEMVREGTLPDGTLTTDRDQPIVMAEPIAEFFLTGAVVHLKNVRNVDPGAHWVVTGQTAKGYRLFPLGGSTRYYTGIAASRLVRVTEIDGVEGVNVNPIALLQSIVNQAVELQQYEANQFDPDEVRTLADIDVSLTALCDEGRD